MKNKKRVFGDNQKIKRRALGEQGSVKSSVWAKTRQLRKCEYNGKSEKYNNLVVE
jgi:hypothetical protein